MFDRISTVNNNYNLPPERDPILVMDGIVGNGGLDEMLNEEIGEDCAGKKITVEVYLKDG